MVFGFKQLILGSLDLFRSFQAFFGIFRPFLPFFGHLLGHFLLFFYFSFSKPLFTDARSKANDSASSNPSQANYTCTAPQDSYQNRKPDSRTKVYTWSFRVKRLATRHRESSGSGMAAKSLIYNRFRIIMTTRLY